jgi:hypothetical protein
MYCCGMHGCVVAKRRLGDGQTIDNSPRIFIIAFTARFHAKMIEAYGIIVLESIFRSNEMSITG